MKRTLALVSTLVFSVLMVLMVLAEPSSAQRRRRRIARKARPAKAAPQSAKIADSLGDIRWGWTPRNTFDHFSKKIEDDYRIKIAKAGGTIEEDNLRREKDDKIKAIRSSFVRFRGQGTGWDTSFIKDEFTHGSNEAVMVIRDQNSQNFYFFINNKLWKWYKAFDASVFAGQNFDAFSDAIQARFGAGVKRNGTLIEGGSNLNWVEWQDRNTRLRAVDQTQFYGFYCLVFEDKTTVGQLATLRRSAIRREAQGGHSIVDSVVRSDADTVHDSDEDIADRLTGRIRRSTQAAPPGTGIPPRGSPSAAPPAGQSPQAQPPTQRSDDPLDGLDF